MTKEMREESKKTTIVCVYVFEFVCSKKHILNNCMQCLYLDCFFKYKIKDFVGFRENWVSAFAGDKEEDFHLAHAGCE